MAVTDFAVDTFELEQLRCSYLAADAKTRIKLLAELLEERVKIKIKFDADEKLDKGEGEYVEEPRLPFEIALLAVEDPNVEVRRWFAQYGKLDFRHVVDDGQVKIGFPTRYLGSRLKHDADPLVRASLYLNDAV